jgi:O-antigen/teichoic acid export membrane protein
MQPGSLKEKIIKASSWTLLSYSIVQVFRVIANIIITRFLPPSDFGVIQLVTTFVQGLLMFSDIGITPNIIQYKKGESREFLRTAWTMQVLRGLFLWGLTFVIAWPLARIYQAPEMMWLLPLNGIILLLSGLYSTNLALLNRHLKMNIVVTIELVANVIGIIAMVASAWYWRSVWTLLVAPLVSTSLQALLSHLPITGAPMRFQWDKESVHELFHFGKWIMLSSILAFLNARLDRIILGLYVSKTDLGLYGIAAGIVAVFTEVVMTLSHRILIPVFAHLRTYVTEEMRFKIEKVRGALELFGMPALAVLVIWGQEVIDLVYPHAYSGAGWMLQILALGGMFKVMMMTINPIFLASGDSYRGMLAQLYQGILLVGLMLAGYYLHGMVGMIVGVALTELLIYPILIPMIKKHRVWLPKFDLLTLVFAFVLLGLVYLTHYYFKGDHS